MGKTYFSHDSNALSDIKISAMRCDYGLEGYGLFWAIIEMFRNEESYKLPLSKNTYRTIKIATGTEIDVENYISDCINEYKETEDGNGLFNTDGKYFWSESLLKRMTKMEEVSEKRKKAGQRGAQGRWGNKQEEKNTKKRKIKNIVKKNGKLMAKNSKGIANAIQNYGKCYKNYGKPIANYSKGIAKNGKSKSKSKSKIKIKIKDIKSIYPSHLSKSNIYNRQQKNEKLDEMMDEIDKMEFDTLITNCELNIFSPELSTEMTEILKEMYMNPETREKIKEINSKKLCYALKNFSIANTKSQIKIPKSYFKKCILSALEQTELSTQYDIDTIVNEISDFEGG